MRGKELIETFNSINDRITPAYAGKSVGEKEQIPIIQDHPRLCGEKFADVERRTLNRRITPAYAGKRLQLSIMAVFQQDHPRLCGEKTKKILKQRYFFHQPASFSFSLQYT